MKTPREIQFEECDAFLTYLQVIVKAQGIQYICPELLGLIAQVHQPCRNCINMLAQYTSPTSGRIYAAHLHDIRKKIPHETKSNVVDFLP